MQKLKFTMMKRIVLWSIAALCLSAQAAMAAPGYTPPSVTPMASAATTPADMSDPYQLNQQEKVKFPQFLGSYYNTVNYKSVKDSGQPTDGTGNSYMQLPDPQQMRQQVASGKQPVRVEAAGYILPSGFYTWDGRTGMVPNPTLAMPGAFTPLNVSDSGYIGPTLNLIKTIDPTMSMRTTSITNGEFSKLMGAAAQMKNELRAQPDRWKEAMRSAQESKQAAQSNNAASGAEQNTQTGWATAETALPNIANENIWAPCSSEAPFKSIQNAAWMVGQMYKQVYIPMAVLLLLPGAVLTQVKITVRTSLVPDPAGYDDDLYSPFSGIMRSMIAVFLIPATQLFVSYTIDVGNSLQYEVTHYRLWNPGIVDTWRTEQTFNTSPQNDMNHIVNTKQPFGIGTTGQEQGKALSNKESQTQFQQQPFMSSTGAQWFNTLDSLMSQGMVCLTAFQIVMIMYLFLLGPVAAALYAWPGVGGDVFRKVYANWMDGVVLVTLWKFWWVVVILCMSIRLQVYQDLMGSLPAQSSFEQFMCAAFTAILMYVPFNPFDFRPGDLVESVLSQAQSQTSKGGSGGAVGGGASPTGGSTASGTSSGGTQSAAG